MVGLFVSLVAILGLCNGASYVPSCPPAEATFTHADGTGIIEVSTSNNATALVSYSLSYSSSFEAEVTQCYPGEPPIYSCPANNRFPITFSLTGGDGTGDPPPKVIKVTYEVWITTIPLVRSTPCEFYVRVLDTGNPVITCPANIVMPGDEQGFTMKTVSWTTPVPTDNSNAAITLTSSIDPFTSPATFPVGVQEITYTAMDQSGNVADCTFTVTITDAEPPQFLDCPTDGITRCTTLNQATASVSFFLPNATDNSGDPPLVECFHVGSSDPLNNLGELVPIGTHDIQCIASDAASNMNTSCEFMITVLGYVPSCPPPEATLTHADGTGIIEVSTTSATALVSYSLSYSSSFETEVTKCYPGESPNYPCPANNRFHITFPLNGGGDGDPPPKMIKVSYEVWITTIPLVRSTPCEFYVRVLDTGNPVITCPANIVMPGDEQGFTMKTVSWTTPVPTDNSNAAITLTSSIDPFTSPATFPVGVQEITYTAMDQSGNVADCTFTVTITDAVAPEFLDCPTDVITRCTTLNQATASVSFFLPNATDNSGDPPLVECFYVGSSDPLNNLGELVPIGTHDIQCNAIDAAGNMNTSCEFMIIVLDAEPPQFLDCPTDGITRCTTLNQATASVSFFLPNATDNSGDPPLVECFYENWFR
ncbi:hyalin-like [Asterias amurensis]|uniref:hyalin-like n=1 Tax=Asterias amurensis TaxID=7602 RepID=UPI003AB68F16